MGTTLSANKPIEYSQVGGPVVPTIDMEVKASQVLSAVSGKLASIDSSGYAEIALAADTYLIGGFLQGAGTSISTDGLSKWPVNIAADATWLMPIAVSSAAAARTEAQLLALLFKTCDIYVSSDIQYAHVDASSTDVLQIVDYAYWGSAAGQQAVVVRIADGKRTVGGVA